jgi:3-phenylpropionate/cinnamic acid dioxygenase small subunit
MIESKQREQINDLLNDYVWYIDTDRLEEWIGFFTDDCTYRVIPRENVEQNLPGVVILCENKNQLTDRIVSYREANEYNLHYDRHIISNPRIENGKGKNTFHVLSNYSVYQSNLDGETRLFSVGYYDDVIVYEGDTPKFKERTVVVDTFSIPTLLATPL